MTSIVDKEKIKRSWVRQLLLPILFFLAVGFSLGWWLKSPQTRLNFGIVAGTNTHGKEIREGGYKFINPLLEYDTGIENSELKPFKYKLESKIAEITGANSQVKDVAVYFRDLNNGPWYGINEEQKFSPASLLKVPLMIAYYKQAESHPALLKEQVQFKVEDPTSAKQFIKPSQSIEVGKTYTVEELVEHMIVYSDNQAKLLLTAYKPEIWLPTYTDLGVSIPLVRGLDDFMSVKEYASFFRILYNASYLNKEDSSKALELLNRSEFTQGLRAGVPSDIMVAHKFGQWEVVDGQQQLHDCGIVYLPKRPYLICVMTRGENLDQLASTIRGVSRFVYDEVSSQTSPGGMGVNSLPNGK